MSQVAANETQSPSTSDDANHSDNDGPSPTPTPNAARRPPKLQKLPQKRPTDKDNKTAMATTTDNNTTNQAMTAQQMDQGLPDSASDQLAQFVPVAQRGRRIVPVHQSRITDRPPKVGEKDSSLKIKIELDLEVEVEIYARVKGDVMIGLM
ncbi:hypothetical protein GJ744_004629 [Endocarpon pusillum]|uniref:Uncharacterized protein n=1 Tax=Endocarpon pusillum TaxID=364733 RepID=A0A8H7ALN1_9EURO|nr:hypothetical protein GJ744_004629 [Endocarpon pusillum]